MNIFALPVTNSFSSLINLICCSNAQALLFHRIWKESSDGATTTTRLYVVDITGDLPTILLELDASRNVKKTYIYANGQIIAQHDGKYTADRYFYLHDRLGSVRQIINKTDGTVENCYTYDPFGEMQTLQVEENVTNPFRFAGQYYDAEINQYYMRARQYDPHIFRFSTRDPVRGCFREPLSLHTYLYCQNDPINKTDPKGEMWGALRRAYRTVYGISSYYTILGVSLEAARSPWEVMDVAIASNAWREAYFDPENLNKPFAWEIAMRNLPSNILELTSGICDWGALGDCVLSVGNKFLGGEVAAKIGGKWSFSALGGAACGACAVEPTKATCIPCVAYIIYQSYTYSGLLTDATNCFTQNCGN